MNPYGDTSFCPHHEVPSPGPSPPPYSPPDNSQDPPLSASPSPPVIQTGHSSVIVWSHNDQDGGEILVRSRPLSPVSASTSNPYPAPSTPPSQQVSVIIPSPDLRPSPLPSQCSEETCPDLECSICFSQFNNIFRCPKMLQCKHTFCLECLARINVKSAQPNAIQCPLCRGLTPLPTLGLPRLATDSNVLSCLPAAMQRVYSIRFLRSKGKLQVKRTSEGHRRWGQRSLTSLRAANRSLDVGLPSPPIRGHGGAEEGGVGGALFRLTGVPACRAFLLTSVVMMMVLLTGIIIFLLTNKGITNRSGF
ncbi:E3 ubiquitin-protein ligase RNF152 [Pempheris klunzingeri]|uniref:E3 ubiquitin-protein ligase RNF152 n=1 Tax=Pempheris klunzingeri TaxID=3127111 RepID=UPI0039800EE6